MPELGGGGGLVPEEGKKAPLAPSSVKGRRRPRGGCQRRGWVPSLHKGHHGKGGTFLSLRSQGMLTASSVPGWEVSFSEQQD